MSARLEKFIEPIKNIKEAVSIEMSLDQVKEIHHVLNSMNPLSKEQIIQVLHQNDWNTDDADSLQDMISLVRSIESAHGIHLVCDGFCGVYECNKTQRENPNRCKRLNPR